MKTKFIILALLAVAFASCDSYNKAAFERLYVENSTAYAIKYDTVKVYFSYYDKDLTLVDNKHMLTVLPGERKHISLNKFQDKSVTVSTKGIFKDGRVEESNFRDYEFKHYYSYELVFKGGIYPLQINRLFE